MLPAAMQDRLKQEGVLYHVWSARALPMALEEGEIVGRFVMSFATATAAVERLVAVLGR